MERDGTFGEADRSVHADVDAAAYHTKHDRYRPAIVGPVVGAQAIPVTIRLLPRG